MPSDCRYGDRWNWGHLAVGLGDKHSERVLTTGYRPARTWPCSPASLLSIKHDDTRQPEQKLTMPPINFPGVEQGTSYFTERY